MKVVLFCGGLGTRIREYSKSIPKPMIPVGDHEGGRADAVQQVFRRDAVFPGVGAGCDGVGWRSCFGRAIGLG